MADEQTRVEDFGGQVLDVRHKVDEWISTLQRWERTAAELVRQGMAPHDAALAVLTAFYQQNGLLTGDDEGISGQPTQQQMLVPSPVAPLAKLLLEEVQIVSNVNALRDGATLPFGPHLTVVYGPNGCGKSGFARVLRDACFTRSKHLDVLGNVRQGSAATPTAKIMANADGQTREFQWSSGGQPIHLLRDHFAVFDTDGITAHVDEPNSLVVSPAGLEVFSGLAELYKALLVKVEADIKAKTPNPVFGRSLDGQSRVKDLLVALSHDSPIEELKSLAALTHQELERLAQIQGEIDALLRTDPKAEIGRLNEIRKDALEIRGKCQRLGAALSDEVAQRLRATKAEVDTLRAKGAAASAAQFGTEPVQPIGTATWATLLRAAAVFSLEACGSDAFPADTTDARCVLCHQLLAPEARDRLRRFWAYLTNTIAHELKAAEAKLKRERDQLESLDLAFLPSDSGLRRSLLSCDPDCLSSVDTYLVELSKRRHALLSQEPSDPALPVGDGPFANLDATCEALAERIKVLSASDPISKIQALREELRLLSHRQYLSKELDQVLLTIERLRWVSKASSAKAGIKTTHLTRKSSDIAKDLLSARYEDRFKQECTSLGFEVPVKIKISGDVGEPKRKLAIGDSKTPPTRVLSEGEQRAAALADFLVEASLRGSVDGIILDDPVNSLDHDRKEKIARRLVEESKKRQVIVFTHDILFVHYLADEALRVSAHLRAATVSLEAESGIPGSVNVLCFPHKEYEGRRLKEADSSVTAAKKLTGREQDEQLLLGISYLRTAYEDFIQEKLFGDVIRRWRENIKYTLKAVYFDNDTAAEVQERLEALSRYVPAHSHTVGQTGVPLTTQLLENEIREYRRIEKQYKDRKKQNRPEAGATQLFS